MSRPNLNDIELGTCLTTILYQARQVTELTANRKALALAECLTKIEDAARKAQWRLAELCDAHDRAQTTQRSQEAAS